MQAFLNAEMEFAYGPGHVAAINPVWDQRVLEGLLDDYNMASPTQRVSLSACVLCLATATFVVHE